MPWELEKTGPLIMWKGITSEPRAPSSMNRKEADPWLYKSYFLSALLISEIKQATPLLAQYPEITAIVFVATPANWVNLTRLLMFQAFIVKFNQPMVLMVPSIIVLAP